MRNLLIIILSFICLGIYSQSEMITDGNFSSDTYWGITSPVYWTISGGEVTYDDGGLSSLYQLDDDLVTPMEASTLYTLTFDISDIATDGQFRFVINSADLSGYAEYIADIWESEEGSYEYEFTTPSDIKSGGIKFRILDASEAFTMDNVSLIKNSVIGASPWYIAPVDSGGNDLASGDIDNPWATWEKAFANAEADDTIYFRGGTYNLTSYIEASADEGEMNSGTKGHPICYYGYPPDIANGDSIIFDFSGNFVPVPDTVAIDSVFLAGGGTAASTQNFGLAVSWADFIEFKGFTIRNVYQTYKYIGCSGFNLLGCTNITLENLYVYNIGGQGIYYDPNYDIADTSYLTNIDLHNCVDSFSVNPTNYFNGMAGTRAHGYFIIANMGDTLVPRGSYITIEGCRAWLCADDGFNTVGLGELVIKNNWSFQNGVYLPHMELPYSSGNGWKVNVPTSRGDFVAQGIIQYIFTNNIGAFNYGYGYSENAKDRTNLNRRVYNNTMIDNSTGFVAHDCGIYAMDTRYINNVAYDNRAQDVLSEVNFSVNTTNSWNTPPGAIVTDADFTLVDEALALAELKAPRKTDNSLPDLTFMTLVSGSDLINAGTDVGLPFNGTAPDIGYAEYGEPPDTIDVTGITISAAASATTITTNNGTLQMTGTVAPDTASFQSVTWSTHSGTGSGSITSGGLVQAVSNGTDTIRATAQDGTGITDDYILTYSNQDDVTIPTVTTSATLGNSTYYVTSGGNGTSDGGASITAKGICWNTTGNPTLSDEYTVDGTGAGSYTSTPVNLNPFQLYYIRAYATNSVGTSYGLNVQATPIFTTKPMKVSPSGSPIFRGGKVVTK